MKNLQAALIDIPGVNPQVNAKYSHSLGWWRAIYKTLEITLALGVLAVNVYDSFINQSVFEDASVAKATNSTASCQRLLNPIPNTLTNPSDMLSLTAGTALSFLGFAQLLLAWKTAHTAPEQANCGEVVLYALGAILLFNGPGILGYFATFEFQKNPINAFHFNLLTICAGMTAFLGGFILDWAAKHKLNRTEILPLTAQTGPFYGAMDDSGSIDIRLPSKALSTLNSIARAVKFVTAGVVMYSISLKSRMTQDLMTFASEGSNVNATTIVCNNAARGITDEITNKAPLLNLSVDSAFVLLGITQYVMAGFKYYSSKKICSPLPLMVTLFMSSVAALFLSIDAWNKQDLYKTELWGTVGSLVFCATATLINIKIPSHPQSAMFNAQNKIMDGSMPNSPAGSPGASPPGSPRAGAGDSKSAPQLDLT